MRPERDALEIKFPRVVGYRVELPDERLTATFNADSILELTPDLVGPSITRNSGIIGEGVDMNLEHLGDLRPSTLLFHVTQRLLYTKWRDPGEEPKLHLFGQLKRITKQWLDTCLVCKGNTYPAQLMYQELADMACNRITAGITNALEGKRPIKALLDPYNPTGSTAYVRFNTSRTERWETSSKSCHINWVVLDSDWEAEFCRVAESHPKVRAYVKNHNLGLEVPYRYGSEIRKYLPDFIVLVDDGRGPEDLLHLIVEIKGYRREDAKEKKSTMETYWVPGVNNLKQYGRWAFAEFTEVYQIESDFAAKVESMFDKMLEGVVGFSTIFEVQSSGVEDPKASAAEFILRHFGREPKLTRLNEAIWDTILGNDEHVLNLSDLERIAGSASDDANNALAIVSLLSNKSVGILKMELRSGKPGGTEVQLAEFTQKLRDWWRNKSITDDEWEQWASEITVKWVPTNPRMLISSERKLTS
jgi:hypothetical protein